MTGAVVITRPLAQAKPLAERVAALGRTVEILPLLDIAPLADQTPLQQVLARLDQYSMVAFVSPNAVDAAFAHIRQWPAGVLAAVVGEGSRAALAAHGVSQIISPADSAHSDSEHLLQTLDLAALNGKPVLIIRGESGRELMADGLRAAGALVDVVPAYRRSVPELTPQLAARLTGLLAQQNDWIITSSEALRGLCNLLAKVDLQQADAIQHNSVVAMQQQHLIVPHARIAETANNLGFSKLTLTGSGDERLLAALQSRL